MNHKIDLLVIGAGPAGLAAAIEAKKQGINRVLLLEREPFAGGILNQCIHDGFGVIKFKETLTGPEYAQRYLEAARAADVQIQTNAMVMDVTADHCVTVQSRSGLQDWQAKAVILSMGCRERTRGALGIPGTRPAGIFTAGVIQHLMNLKNIKVGQRVVILGSGDIGLIMARRLTLEGAKVEAVVEKLPYPSGLPRNLTQCLEDYGIPLLLRHTVTRISGRGRLQSVVISALDARDRPVRGKSRLVPCDTLVLSVGLIPENELSLKAGVRLDGITGGPVVDENLQAGQPGFFSCGNALQVHDLVDHVSAEAEMAGRSAATLIRRGHFEPCAVNVYAGPGVRYVVPNLISGKQDVTFSMRVNVPTQNQSVVFRHGDKEIRRQKCRRLNPAEMVRVTIPASALAGLTSLEVKIDD